MPEDRRWRHDFISDISDKMKDEVEMETILYSCGSVFGNIEAGEEDDSLLMNIHVPRVCVSTDNGISDMLCGQGRQQCAS